MRESLCWKTSEPPAEELADEYINSLETRMKSNVYYEFTGDCDTGDAKTEGYRRAVSEMIVIMRGEDARRKTTK